MLKSTSFVFNGIPSENYNVMIYFLEDSDMRELSLGTDVEVIEDRLPKRTTPIHYGVDLNKPMSFPLTFGSTDYLEDYDVDAILSWLTGHQQYKWLEFVDGDHYVRYKCYLNNMQSVYINGLPTAFTCDVVCDGQFAYEYPTVNTYEIDDTEAYIEYFNKSAYNGYLYPRLNLELSDACNSFSIINESDNNREFKINYFDRVVENIGNDKYEYDTTLAKEIGSDPETSNFISWKPAPIATSGYYGDIVKGVVNNVETWIALPSNGKDALYSTDKGNSWHLASPALPHVGNWTGCFGDAGFVAICTDNNSAVASHSQTGKAWTRTVIELPTAQKWNKVVFVKTEGFMPNQYLAIGGVDSSIAAISVSGWSWQLSSLPLAQEWRSAFTVDGKVFVVGGNTNKILTSTDCVHWKELELPKNAAWSAGCHGPAGYLLLADTLYGSGSREPIALKSADGEVWEVIEFPIGAWSDVEYSNNVYTAIGDRQFAYSFDSLHWENSTLPTAGKNLIGVDNGFICTIGTNEYLMSHSQSSVEGSFSFEVPADPELTVKNVYVSALLENTADVINYSSNGIKLLATNIIEAGEANDEAEVTGGNYVALTTDLRREQGVDGVMVSSTFDINTKVVTINYVVDSNHTEVLNAPLIISVEYQTIAVTDLGYAGLTVDFDNQNQIITTNKESLNMYEYFNKKFLRLVKGLNKLRMKTNAGSCKVTITSEFLRKAGGR